MCVHVFLKTFVGGYDVIRICHRRFFWYHLCTDKRKTRVSRFLFLFFFVQNILRGVPPSIIFRLVLSVTWCFVWLYHFVVHTHTRIFTLTDTYLTYTIIRAPIIYNTITAATLNIYIYIFFFWYKGPVQWKYKKKKKSGNSTEIYCTEIHIIILYILTAYLDMNPRGLYFISFFFPSTQRSQNMNDAGLQSLNVQAFIQFNIYMYVCMYICMCI